MTVRFSVIVPTIGRPSLVRALDSVAGQLDPEDELVVVGHPGPHLVVTRAGCRVYPHRPAGDWGYTERAIGIAHAHGTHLMFLDDDDVYLPGAIAHMRATVAANPDAPILFRMVAPWGEVLWRRPLVRAGNVSGVQFVLPNDPARIGVFSDRYEADYDFIVSTLAHYPEGALVWDETVTYACRPEAA